MTNIIPFSEFVFDDNTIKDDLVNISALASAYQKATISPRKPNGIYKRPDKWLITQEAQDSIAYLARAVPKRTADLVIVENGVGTWVHPDLAEIFAQWISVEYRFAVVRLIRDTKEKKEFKKFPNQITGDIPTDPVIEFASQAMGLTKVFFPSLEPEIQTGIAMEATFVKHPELRASFEPHKPKLLIEAPLLTPTEIGLKLEQKDGIKRSAIAVNRLLIERGFQVKTGDKKLAYRAIGQGIEFSKVVADTASGHGKTITSLRWYESIAELLQTYG